MNGTRTRDSKSIHYAQLGLLVCIRRSPRLRPHVFGRGDRTSRPSPESVIARDSIRDLRPFCGGFMKQATDQISPRQAGSIGLPTVSERYPRRIELPQKEQVLALKPWLNVKIKPEKNYHVFTELRGNKLISW